MTIFKKRYSDVALLLGLVLLLSLVRIYYGGGHGLMVVWKGQPGFADTLVNLSEVTQMPVEQLRREHPSVHWQLVAMELLDDNTELDSVRSRVHKQRKHVGSAQPKPLAPVSEGSGS